MGRVQRSPRSGLIGRKIERTALSDALADVIRTRRGHCLLLTGEPGIGKTSIVRDLVDLARERATVTAFELCTADSSAPSMWPWPNVVQQLAPDDASPRPDGPTPPATMFDTMSATWTQLCAISEPAVIVLDDLHLSDPVGLRLTRFIVERAWALPLLIVATTRPPPASDGPDLDHQVSPAGEALGSLIEMFARVGTVIDLPRFDRAEVARFVQLTASPTSDDGLPVSDPTQTERLWRLSGGNPLLLQHLAAAPPESDGPPVAIDAIVRPRINTLDPDLRAVADAAAIAGASADVGVVASMIQSSVSDVATRARQMSDLIRVDDHVVTFVHEVVPTVVDSMLTTTTRLDLHHACERALAASGTDRLAARARHAIAAAERGVDEAERALELAASAASDLSEISLDRRAQLLREAIEIEERCLRRTPSLDRRLVHAETVLAAGSLREARELFRTILSDLGDDSDATHLARAALGLGGVWVEDERQESERGRMLSACGRALELLPRTARTLRAQLEVRLAAERFYDAEISENTEVERWIDELRAIGDDLALAQSLSLLHHTMLGPQHGADRLAVADEMVAAASRAGSDIQQALGMCWRTVDLFLLGDSAAERSLEDTRRRAAAIGSRSVDYMVQVIDVMLLARRGRLDEAAIRATEVYELGLDVGDQDAFAYFSGQIAAIEWMRGTWAHLLDTVAEASRSTTLRSSDMVYPAVHAAVLAECGRLDEARGVLRRFDEMGLGHLVRNGSWLTTMCALVEAARLVDDPQLASRLAQQLEPFAALPTMPSLAIMCLGPVARYLSAAHLTAGDVDRALEAAEIARTVNHRIQNQPCECLVLGWNAEVLLARDGPTDRMTARGLLADAAEAADRIGLTLRAESFRALLDGIATDALANGHATAPPPQLGHPLTAPDEPPSAGLRRDDNGWTIEFGDRTLRCEHTIGLTYLAALLSRPGIEIPAIDLADVGGERFSSDQAVLDHTALSAFRTRLADLDTEIDEMGRFADTERLERLRSERSAVVAELSRSVGLGARSRRLPSDTERARSRVSKAIRRSITRLAELDPALGYELTATIKTGRICAYEPDATLLRRWRVTADR